LVQIAQLEASVTADTTQFDAAMRSVDQQLKNVPRTAADASSRASGFMDGMTRSAGGLGGGLLAAASGGVAFAAGMAAMQGISAAVSAVGDSVVGLNQRLEQSRIAFTTMLGSAQQADAFLKELADFAAKTPFNFPELVTASQQMLAMGFAAQEIVPMLTAVGNAAAALGAGNEGIARITYALGQMRTATKVTAGDMRQLTQVGVPAWQILADAMGKSVSEVQRLSEQGQISADVFIKAFQEFSKQKFGDQMGLQSKTFLGAMSTVTDSVTMWLAKAGKPFFDMLTQIAVKVADLVQTKEFQDWADRIATSLVVIGKVAGGVFSILETAANLAAKALEPIGAAIQGIGGVLAQTAPIWQRFGEYVATWAKTLLEGIRAALGGLDALGKIAGKDLGLVKAFDDATAAVSGFASELGKTISAGADGQNAAEKVYGPFKSEGRDAAQAIKLTNDDILAAMDSFQGDLFKDAGEVKKAIHEGYTAAVEEQRQAAQRLADVETRAGEQRAQAAQAAQKALAAAQQRYADAVASAVEERAKGLAAAEKNAADATAQAIQAAQERLVEIEQRHGERVAEAVAARGATIDEALDLYNQRIAEIEQSSAEKVGQAQAQASEQIAQAIAQAAERHAQIESDARDQQAAAVAQATERLAQLQHDAAEKRAEIVARAAERIAQAERDADEQRRALAAERTSRIAQAELTYAQGVAQAVQRASDQILAAQQQAADRIAQAIEALQQQRSDRSAEQAFDRRQSAEARARQQSRDDEEAYYHFQQDLAGAADEAEKQRITDRFARAEEERARQRARQEEDRLFAEQQAAERQAFMDKLADDALQRTIAQAAAERDARLVAVEQELAARRDALTAARAAEIVAVDADNAAKLAKLNDRLVAEKAAADAARAADLAAVDKKLADETAKTNQALADRQDAIRRAAEKAQAALEADLVKREAAINASLARELAANAAAVEKQRAEAAKQRDEQVARAEEAYQKSVEAAQKAADQEVAATVDAEQKKLAAINQKLADETAALDAAYNERLAKAAHAYAMDVYNANQALAQKEADVAASAEKERQTLLRNYADKIRDIREKFIAQIPKGAEVPADNYLQRLIDLQNQLASGSVAARPQAGVAAPTSGPAAPAAVAGPLTGGVTIVPIRDEGGPGAAGEVYQVGRGPYKEWFVPASSGRFEPMGPEPSMTQTIPIYIGGELLTTVVARANQRYADRGGRLPRSAVPTP